MKLLLKNNLPVIVIFTLGVSISACDIINMDSGPVYHSYASMSVSADTVQAGNNVEVNICVWNYGNDLYNLMEETQSNQIRFQVLLKGKEPGPEKGWCPVGTGNIILKRNYTLVEPGTHTFSMVQPDGNSQDRVVVVK